MKVKLAEALLRRKELQNKMLVLNQIKGQNCFDVRVQRVKVSDGVDEVTAAVPKMTASQFTKEFDWHARQLRLIDAAIQNTNWTAEVEVGDEVMGDFKG